MSDFVPLHVHTEYSLLDGAISIKKLVSQAKTFGMPAVAITDHGNIFGAVEFFAEATKAGLKPIIGCECYIAPTSRKEKTRVSVSDNSDAEEYSFHIILLVKDQEGYHNLCTLLSQSYIDGFYHKPRIDKELLSKHSAGLIGCSACLKGEIPYHIILGQPDKALQAAKSYLDIFAPDNFYLELQHNSLPEQAVANKGLLEISSKLNIPVIATNDCHYLNKEDATAHDILLCIQTGKSRTDVKRLKFGSDDFYFRSPTEMHELFREIPQAILNTKEVAEKCNFHFSLGKSLLPQFSPPEGFTAFEYLQKLAYEGLQRVCKGNVPENYSKRLAEELRIIDSMDFASYFLIVQDFINHAKQKGIPVGPGRGSAAGSLVAYCLSITEIDPIRYDLLFERFLNPERISMPDIDVDFCRDRRQEVIDYVSHKYGANHVAQIITFGTMGAKAVIRDVGRVLDIPLSTVDKIAKLVPEQPDITIAKAVQNEPKLAEFYQNDSKIKELLDIAERLEGLARHASKHAAGIVIAPDEITKFTPLFKQPAEDAIVTQFDMKSLEKIGLLKFDFLGLKTLTIINQTANYIRQKGIDFDIRQIPFDDAKTFELLSKGDTISIFQLESAGMRNILVRLEPNRFEDLIALVALYRPGPLAWIDDFIKRKKGEVPVSYELPELKEILDETFGIIIYQEQVMRIANKVAGFSMGQADILRRAMGKKDDALMKKQKEIFIAGAVKNGYKEDVARRLFEMMEPFALYGFNKSHSAAYAYLAYQTAYLKAHYRVEFMTANLSADMGDTKTVVKLITDCQSSGIDILPPDINECQKEFTIVGNAIRFGLVAVKGVGASAIEAVLKERQKGRFKSFEDFLSRVDPKKVNKKVIESLIKAGAFDSLLAPKPPQEARAKAMQMFSDPFMCQSNLFDCTGISSDEVTAWDDKTLLAHEKESLGFYISGHPMATLRRTLASMQVSTISELDEMQDSDVCIAGIITELKSKLKAKGITTYITLEDETGVIELLYFPENGKKTPDFVKKGSIVLAKGTLIKSEKSSKVICRSLEDKSDLKPDFRYEIEFDCRNGNFDPSFLSKLKPLLVEDDSAYNSSVKITLILDKYKVSIKSNLKPISKFDIEFKKLQTTGVLKVL